MRWASHVFFTVLLHNACFIPTIAVWNIPLLLWKLSFAHPVGISSPTWRRLHRSRCLWKKDLSCFSHCCIALGIKLCEISFYTVTCNWTPLSSCLWPVHHSTFTFERYHATAPNQGEGHTAEPKHKQCFSLLLLGLLLLYNIHFCCFICNSRGSCCSWWHSQS